MLTSDEAFHLVKQAGILQNKQTFLRYVREGKIPARIRHKRDGYRFEETHIHTFIDLYDHEQTENPLEELYALRQENEALRHRLHTPESMLEAENIRLMARVRELEHALNQTQLAKKNQYPVCR